jgi:phospholipid/cholesterol/gamma-HCH transport system substrate-binding protein
MSRLARVGLFIFATLVILGTAVFVVGDKQLVFSNRYSVQASFDNVAGLINGADVRIGGVRKGTVREIHLLSRPHERVAVVMDLEDSTRKVIKKDSVAAIETEGLLGNKYVTISFGSPDADPIQPGDTLQSLPPVDLADLVKKTNEIMDTTNLALKSFTVATANIEAITRKVNRGEGTMGALINDPKIYNELSTVASEAHKTVAEAKVGATALQENMQALKQNWLFRGFFKNRGYQDVTELTKHTIPEIPGQPPSQVFTFDAKNLFNKSNTAKLRNEKSLNRVGEFLETNPFGLVVVTAFQGLAGDSEEDLVLSQARAMVVRQYLVEKFKLDDTRIKTKGFGKGQPGQEGKADRIQVLIYSPGVRMDVSKTEDPHPVSPLQSNGRPAQSTLPSVKH